MLPAPPETRPEQEPDAMRMVVDRNRIAAVVLEFPKRGRS
jgi:hypothetical protein